MRGLRPQGEDPARNESEQSRAAGLGMPYDSATNWLKPMVLALSVVACVACIDTPFPGRRMLSVALGSAEEEPTALR